MFVFSILFSPRTINFKSFLKYFSPSEKIPAQAHAYEAIRPSFRLLICPFACPHTFLCGCLCLRQRQRLAADSFHSSIAPSFWRQTLWTNYADWHNFENWKAESNSSDGSRDPLGKLTGKDRRRQNARWADKQRETGIQTEGDRHRRNFISQSAGADWFPNVSCVCQFGNKLPLKGSSSNNYHQTMW